MYASVNEIHVVLNQRVEAQELLETAHRVEELATQLAGHTTTNEKQIENELINAVTNLQSQIKTIAPSKIKNSKIKAIPKSSPEELESTSVECPSCNTETPVKIGEPFGASAMPSCLKCNTQFHAHRAKDGTILSKLPGTN